MKMLELFAVQDIFATALGRVDILQGGFARFVWFVERKCDDGTTDNVIVASIIMSADTIPKNRQIVDAVLGRGAAMEMRMAGVELH